MALQASLIGEIYSDIRAVVFKYDANMNHFILRYYQEREPNVNDYESISIVISNFLAQFKFSDFENKIPGNKKCGRDYKLQNVSITFLNGDGAIGNDLSFILSNLTSLNQK